MKKYIKHISIVLLILTCLQLYSAFVSSSAKRWGKLEKQAIQLIEKIAKNASGDEITLPSFEDIKKLRKLSPYIPKRYKKYTEIRKILKNIPKEVLKKDPKTIAAARKYMKDGLTIKEIESEK